MPLPIAPPSNVLVTMKQWDDAKAFVKTTVKSYFKGKEGGHPYPSQFKNLIINDFKTVNWNKNLTYSFKVIDSRNSTFKVSDFESEFKLSINPLELTQDETFSINITPTQGGVISEHNGIIFRDLIISGTTGVHVGRGSTGVSSKGVSLFSPSSKSGYEEFQELRNYFRAYAEYKKQNEEGSRFVQLIFVNRKDCEELIVEPVKFSMKRSGAKGPLYDYEIVLKVIGNQNHQEDTKGILEKLGDIRSSINDGLDAARGALLGGQSLITQIEREVNNTIYEPFRQIDLLVKTALGVTLQLWHMGARIKDNFSSLDAQNYLKTSSLSTPSGQNIITSTTSPIQSQNILNNMSLYNQSLLPIPTDISPSIKKMMEEEIAKIKALITESFIKHAKDEVERVKNNAADAFGLGDPGYDSYANRIPSFVPSLTKQTTNQEIEILYAFNKLTEAYNTLLAYSSSILKKDSTKFLSGIENSFNNLVSMQVPNSVSEVIIPPNTTLEDLSFQHLKDYSRWPELAKLNNLIPPYIQETSTNPRIKQYGAKLLIPQTQSPSITDIITSKENNYNKGLTETEKRLGVDLQLSDSFDFVMNNRNDFEFIVGGQNAEQAIRIKLNLEKGDLRLHPEVGIGLILGEKNVDIDFIYDQIIGVILQDSRFSSIKDFDLIIDGNALILKLNLLVAESATPVPLSLNL